MLNQTKFWKWIVSRLPNFLVRRGYHSPPVIPLLRPNVLDLYVTSAPTPQNALDIFQGEWVSQLPGPMAALRAGPLPVFEDVRIEWAVRTLGGVSNKRVLELGPLEGAHTYMLERLGAAEVIAIEANTLAYLKCLIIKEVLEMTRVRFLMGDFLEYLRANKDRFDVCLASGVLYHMRNPVELIELIAAVADRVFIWTHYYDHTIIASYPDLAYRLSLGTPSEHAGFRHTLYRQEYKAALEQINFCGGSATYSQWMTRDDILACLTYFGLSDISTHFEQPDHIHGPAFALTASRPR